MYSGLGKFMLDHKWSMIPAMESEIRRLWLVVGDIDYSLTLIGPWFSRMPIPQYEEMCSLNMNRSLTLNSINELINGINSIKKGEK